MTLRRAAVDGKVGQDPFVDAVVVERIARRHLEVPDHLAGLGLKRQHGVGVEIVALAIERIPRRRIAGAPVDQIKVGIIGTGDPGRAAALFPGIAGPGLGAGLALFGNRIGAPERFTGLRIEPFEIAADAVFRARNARNDDAVRHQRRDRHGVAVLRIRRLRAPDLLAGLGIERDHIGVEGCAIELAVEQRRAAIDDAAANDARRLRRIFDHGLPDFPAGQRIDRHRLLVVGEKDHAVLHQGLALEAAIVGHTVGPRRHQSLDGLTIDLSERAEAVLAIAHAVGQHVARRLVVVLELVGGLSERRHRNCRAHERGQQCRSHHDVVSSSSRPAALFVVMFVVIRPIGGAVR